ncbi:MAG: hypothetical protein ACRC0M_08035, partial [Legionella sp.]
LRGLRVASRSFRNLFAVAVSRYTKSAQQLRSQFQLAKEFGVTRLWSCFAPKIRQVFLKAQKFS